MSDDGIGPWTVLVSAENRNSGRMDRSESNAVIIMREEIPMFGKISIASFFEHSTRVSTSIVTMLSQCKARLQRVVSATFVIY